MIERIDCIKGEKIILPIIILEAVALQDHWFWHAFFDLSESLNDINVLHLSSHFINLAKGQAPKVNNITNGHNHTMIYYFVDDIYPKWVIIIKTIPSP